MTEQLPPIQINAQYVKDLSFEIPNAPQIFGDLQNGSPDVAIQVNLRSVNVQGPLYETVLGLHVEGKINDKVAFILELSYAGLFTVNVPEEQLERVLFIDLPHLLFPFARSIVANVSRDGGLPPLMLQPIDFVSLYLQRNAQQQGQA